MRIGLRATALLLAPVLPAFFACADDRAGSLPAEEEEGGDASRAAADAAEGDSVGEDARTDPGDALTAGDAAKFSTDRAAFFGPTRCANAGVAFCEDFEKPLDGAIWTSVGATKPSVDATDKMRGAMALHVSITGNGASYIKTKKPFPALANAYWGRAFFRFGKLPGAPLTYAHWTFAAATGSGVAGEIRLSGQLSKGKNLFGVGTDNRVEDAGTGDWTTSDDDPKGNPRAVPTGEWMCIEWNHDGNTDETRFFWDAVEHPSMRTTKTIHGGNANPYVLPTFDTVWVGWQEYQATTLPFEMWVDEVAFDGNRIGCVL